MNRTRQAGLTLIEMASTLVVVRVTLSAALPSFQQARERRHLDGAAAQLATDLRHARSMAVARGSNLRFAVQQGVLGSCTMVHTGAAADCRCAADGTAVCRNGAQALQVSGFPTTGLVQVSANSASMLLEADRGTVTPTGTLRVQAASGRAVHQVVSLMGRVRACSPGGSALGYTPC